MGDTRRANDDEDFDPFSERHLEHPVSDCETLTHLIKASLGTGILSMPAAFRASGLVLGVCLTIVVAIICTHCKYILVVCAHELYKRSRKTQMSYADVAEDACLYGPKWARSMSGLARKIIQVGMFVAYFLTSSCYSVIIAGNFNYVVEVYVDYKLNIRITIALLLIPLILLVYVPNLKYLVPFSIVANIFMAIGLGITFYYLVNEKLPSVSERVLVANVKTLPIFISVTIFAIQFIGLVMPLENNMKDPRHFIGGCGILNRGMIILTTIYTLLGFFGYLRFGNDVKGSITLNLPIEEYPAQAVNILIGLAVMFTFTLKLYVCIEIVWNGIKHHYKKHEFIAQYIMRTVMAVICISLAIAVPTIIPFVSLIGAFCFSILGLMVPVGIETLTFWDQGFGRYNWKILKNIVVVFVAGLALIFGSKAAIEDIIKMYL